MKNKNKSYKVMPHFINRIVKYYLLFIVYIISQSTLLLAQGCPSRTANEALVSNYRNSQEIKHRAMLTEWYAKYSAFLSKCENDEKGNNTGSKSFMETKTEQDENGADHYYVAISKMSDGSPDWTEVDRLPNAKGEKDDFLIKDDMDEGDCSALAEDLNWEAGKCDDQGNLVKNAGYVLEAVSQIPCDIYIEKIECIPYISSSKSNAVGDDIFSPTACTIIFKNSDATSIGGLQREKQFKQFYDTLAKIKKEQEELLQKLRLQNILRSQFPDQSGLSGLIDRDLSSMKGRSFDLDKDGKTDYIWRKDSDGTERKYEDSNGDGRADAVTIRRPDETATLIIDSDLDGKYDKKVEIAADGSRQYYDLDKRAQDNYTKGSLDGIQRQNTPELIEKKIIRSELYKSIRGSVENANTFFEKSNTVEKIVFDPENKTFSGAASSLLGYTNTAWSFTTALINKSTDAAIDAIQDGFGYIANFASKPGGALGASMGGFNQFMLNADVFEKTFDASLGQLSDVLEGKEVNPAKPFLPLLNDFGDKMGIKNFGNNCVDLYNEGNE